jgi:thioredoxin 1
MKNKSLLKILLVLLVAIVIIVIWAVKNNSGDYGLEAESIDLKELKSYGLPIVIDFGSDSCIPCKEMAPVLKKANADYKGKAIIKFVDVWKYPDSADGFPIQVIPTQVFINADGTPYVPSKDLGIKFIQYNSSISGGHAFTVHQGGLTEAQMEAILADMGAVK